MSNELPRFTDAADALTSRMLILELARSWYGKEDVGLTDKLIAELPGILLWAIEGWNRLREARVFRAAEVERWHRRRADRPGEPGEAWVRERCVEGPTLKVSCKDAYADFASWCEDAGHRNVPTQTTFGRDLKAATSCRRGQVRIGTSQVWAYLGLEIAR